VTRARCAVNLRSVSIDRDDLWSFIMLPDAPPVSRLPFPLWFLVMRWCGPNTLLVEGDCGRRVIRSTDAPGSGGRLRRAAAGTRAGGA
jgi:hypothetical protein